MSRWQIASIFVVAGLLAARLVVLRHVPRSVLRPDNVAWLALLVIVLGLFLRSWAASVLTKSTELTTSGPYAMCRHPLYVGSTLLVIGFCLLVSDLPTAAVLFGLWIAIARRAVAQEEAQLAKLFSDSWPTYVQEVPAWGLRLPRGVGPVRITQWWKNGEWRAVLATLLGLALLEAWRAYLVAR
jgi:protein-S-isoprenylcysteine O-methyltransferase Ste14